MVEERKPACTPITLPTSPPPTFDDFVPATTSGSGRRRQSAARSDRRADSISCWSARSSPRLRSACAEKHLHGRQVTRHDRPLLGDER